MNIKNDNYFNILESYTDTIIKFNKIPEYKLTEYTNIKGRIYILNIIDDEMDTDRPFLFSDLNKLIQCIIKSVEKYMIIKNNIIKKIDKKANFWYGKDKYFPYDLSEIGISKPLYDNKIIFEPNTSYGMRIKYLLYSVITIDLPDLKKYKFELNTNINFDNQNILKIIKNDI